MTDLVTYHPPTRDEWTMLSHQADVLAQSAIVPQAFRGKPADIIVATLTARELGIGPMAALNHIAVINGRATLSSEGMVALVRSRGHSISGTTTDDAATVTGKRHDTGDEMTVTFTLQDATRAGLLRNAVWKSYPADMCWARAVSKLCRRLFSDVISGLSYTPEEAESFSDAPRPPAAAASDGGEAPVPPQGPAPTPTSEGEVDVSSEGKGADATTSPDEGIEDAEILDVPSMDKAERARLIASLHGIWRHMGLAYTDDEGQRVKRWMLDKYGVSLSKLPDDKLRALHGALTSGDRLEKEQAKDRFKAAVEEWAEANPMGEEK